MEYHKLSKKVVKESLGVDTSGSTLIPPKGCKKIVQWRIQTKTGEKLSLADGGSSGSMATSTRKALKIEVERGSQSDSLLKNDFAKKPLQHKENSGTEVKLDASGEFAGDKAWKPLLTTEQIKDNRGMGAT
ncbi:adhesin [Mycoplasmoides genitalium]|uniref:adhesin n=1 Tax=Mycoplasmoides genitalium TaxID=2097 RepID=UPI0040558A97